MKTELFEQLLLAAEPYQAIGEVPSQILEKLADTRQQVEGLASIARKGSHGEYFLASKERYAHYVAACETHVTTGRRILDVGNAPGHFAYLLTTIGYDVKGLNLDAAWRGTYPDPAWVKLFDVKECDIESSSLPYPDNSFDAVIFTEVLEHIAINHPMAILEQFKRVLVQGGVVIFSTPNVCNLSNVIALMLGKNVYWPTNVYYGSLDRHNREWTPAEVAELFQVAGFTPVSVWGMCDHSNWRTGAAQVIYEQLAEFVDKYAMMRNTIVGVYQTPVD